jgi:hypothetical protein
MHACVTTVTDFYNTKEGNMYAAKMFSKQCFESPLFCGVCFSVNSCLTSDNRILQKYFCLYLYVFCCKCFLKGLYFLELIHLDGAIYKQL